MSDPVATAPGSVPAPQLARTTRGKLSRVDSLNLKGVNESMSSEELNELLGKLAETPTRIQSLLNDISDEQLRRRHSEGEFSFVENVCHLRDIEVEGYATRLNRILEEDRPSLPDIDGGRLAVERDYNKQDAQEALRAFSLARTKNLSTLGNLGPQDLSREGTLEGVGTVKLKELLVMMRDHDGSHLKDIEQIRRRLADDLMISDLRSQISDHEI